ncbi:MULTISPECIES: cytochrome c552 [Methylobacterium]|jgi:mono/diheme cytochrome c family protein|uniref:Cytochrome c, mono-and diheme variants n=2 Tax=Methylobacterium TaxID=407 RepID=A0AAE8HWC4_9HYPH|nr:MULTISPECIES: cytochrome c552 [Methylobacterium]KOX48862.1 cytochrome C552 [Streptomyces purpurogeneiscleroticus]AIQ92374.1 Putative cytochrome c552 [Methylobacterium oryzae CBMB20]APT32824.1 respiration [Methylobacterium phyllosphaerae]AWV15997.1 cytochrome C552 [Methylobacterium sp. XJLW]MBP30508.1 cytochrome C552 [Methylobacterium sp.]
MTVSRPAACAALLAGLLAVGTGAAAADPDEGHRLRGWTIATQLCSPCHVIGRVPQAGDAMGPSFVRIANMPSTTGLALNVFLQSHHQRMPSLRLDRDEMDAVIDYILSLKEAEAIRP